MFAIRRPVWMPWPLAGVARTERNRVTDKTDNSPASLPLRAGPRLHAGPTLRAGHGVLVRARNGDVIGYDPTGLVLRLSDRVIDDIALRLGGRLQVEGQPPAANDLRDVAELEALLDGRDVWNIRAEGDWLRFSGRLPGRQGPRDFRLCRAGGDVVAEAPGAVVGILGIGGPRAALANPEGPAYPFHILAPADDIGAVGHAGVERAAVTDLLSHLREMTHEALMAEVCLDWQLEKHAGLPVFVTRVETDSSSSAPALAEGVAVENLLRAAGNLKLAAARLGKPARIFAVTLDFVLEAVAGTATDYRDGMLSLMVRVEAGLAKLGFDRPLFVARFEAGRPGLTLDRVIEAQWELAWNCGAHRLVISAPSHMFAHDEYDRPTDEARRHMAAMSAAAASAAAAQTLQPNPLTDGWRCPVIHLAELEAGPKGSVILRLVLRALGDLALAPGDAVGGDRPVGFALDGDTAGAKILSVTVDPADAQAVLLTLDRRPEGAAFLRYGYGEVPEGPGQVAVRDGWQLAAADGRMLHRWALPCRLAVREGAAR